MPTYDYKCRSCNHSFDKFQTMTAEVLKLCPKCNENKLERLIGKGMGIIFKGSGFYSTDYKKEKNQKSNKDNPEKSVDKSVDKKEENKKEANKVKKEETKEKALSKPSK